MPMPFSKGTFRLAFYLRVNGADGKIEKFVAKRPIVSKDAQDEQSCKIDIRNQV